MFNSTPTVIPYNAMIGFHPILPPANPLFKVYAVVPDNTTQSNISFPIKVLTKEQLMNYGYYSGGIHANRIFYVEFGKHSALYHRFRETWSMSDKFIEPSQLIKSGVKNFLWSYGTHLYLDIHEYAYLRSLRSHPVYDYYYSYASHEDICVVFGERKDLKISFDEYLLVCHLVGLLDVDISQDDVNNTNIKSYSSHFKMNANNAMSILSWIDDYKYQAEAIRSKYITYDELVKSELTTPDNWVTMKLYKDGIISMADVKKHCNEHIVDICKNLVTNNY